MLLPFPTIETTEDLPRELIQSPFELVQKQDEAGLLYTVVTYRVGWASHFGNRVENGMWLREFRGLVFDQHGNLVCRPLPKIFNIEEDHEWREDPLPLNPFTSEPSPVLAYKKLDGSMIGLGLLHGKPRFFTKAGITDTSLRAEALFNPEVVYNTYTYNGAWRGYTHIFEFVGPSNPHVVRYEEDRLVYLASRSLKTGRLYPNRELVVDVDSLEEVRKWRDQEGVILYKGQHPVKVKSDWFFEAHKICTIRVTPSSVYEAWKVGIEDDLLAKKPEEAGFIRGTVAHLERTKENIRRLLLSYQQQREPGELMYMLLGRLQVPECLWPLAFGEDKSYFNHAWFRFLKNKNRDEFDLIAREVLGE